MDINYSIIIPHKNIPDLLFRCLDSIPVRDDVQVIVVDDNSDPNIVDFENFPGVEKENVEVIFSKTGKGAGAARNEGLNKVLGEWVLFADADDYFSSNAFVIFDSLRDSRYDLIYFGTMCFDAITKREHVRGQKYVLLMESALLGDIDKYKYNAYVPFAKMVRRVLLQRHSISFDETRVANDVMCSLKIAYYSECTGIDNRCVYIREARNGSLMSQQSIDYVKCRFDVYVRVNDFLSQIDREEYQIGVIPSLIKFLLLRDFRLFMNSLVRLMSDKNIGFIRQLRLLFYRILCIKTYL